MVSVDVRSLHVKMAADQFRPRSFRWRGELCRVLAVTGISTHGVERRFRVLTRRGRFELAFSTQAGQWQMRREPGWVERAWARVRRLPRYPLPPWRRRAYKPRPARRIVVQRQKKEGGYANRLALVRQRSGA